MELNPKLLHLGVFCVRLPKNRDVGVRVFPEREEILVGSLRLIFSPDKTNARPNCTCASAPIGSAPTIPR